MSAAERGDRVVNPLRQTASAEQDGYTLSDSEPDATAVIGDLTGSAEEGGQRLEDAAVGDDAVTEGLEGVTAQQILTAQRLLMVCGTGTRMTWYAVNVAIAYFSDLYVSQPAA